MKKFIVKFIDCKSFKTGEAEVYALDYNEARFKIENNDLVITDVYELVYES